MQEQCDILFDNAKTLVKNNCTVKEFLEKIGPSYFKIIDSKNNEISSGFNGNFDKIDTAVLDSKIIDINLFIVTEEYGGTSPWQDDWAITIKVNSITNNKKKKSFFSW